MTAEYTETTRRCPVKRLQNLENAKAINDAIVNAAPLVHVYRGKHTSEELPQEAWDLMHLKLEEALGGVTRPAQGFLPETLKPGPMRPDGEKGWALEVERFREHERRALKASDGDPNKLQAFHQQFGLEHQPILNNHHDKRAWARIVRDL
jgi:hypothetical protein